MVINSKKLLGTPFTGTTPSMISRSYKEKDYGLSEILSARNFSIYCIKYPFV